MEGERFVLVTGCMRSGTTLTSAWLGATLAAPHVALRESGIPNFMHSLLSAMAFHQRDHAFAYRYPAGSSRRRQIERIRDLVLGMYADLGWPSHGWIVDKVPYALSDAARFYGHLSEVFPRLRHVHLVRDPYEVIASMRARTWGRPPFPRDPHISPLPFQLETELENLIGDEPAEGPGEPGRMTSPRRRSLEQCCLHYELALRGFMESESSADALVLDYGLLRQADAVRRCVSDYLGTELREAFSFRERRDAPGLTAGERETVDALLSPETRERREALAERALRSLRPFLSSARQASTTAVRPSA